jgi:hypothetical protein
MLLGLRTEPSSPRRAQLRQLEADNAKPPMERDLLR